MKDIINEYIEDNFISAESLAELAENMSSYEINDLWNTVIEMDLETDAEFEDLNKYR